MSSASRRTEEEMFQKGLNRPFFSSRTATSRPLSEATEMYDTDFEEDMSDIEEYSGRRSEESVSPRTPKSSPFCGLGPNPV